MLTQFRQTLNNQWSFKPVHIVKNRPTSLTHKTLINMALRVTGVVLVSAGVSYVHVMSRLEAQTQAQLEKYIRGRRERESSIFQLAQDNLAMLGDRLSGQVFISIQVLISGWFRQLYLFMRAIASWVLWDMMWF